MAVLSGGQNVEKYFRDLAQKVSRGGTLEVGFMSNAKYPDGTSVALVAAIQEFGSARIPPRPFFRNMIAAKSAGWGPSAARILVNTNYDTRATLDMLGIGISDQLRASINSNTPPPNAPSTVARKGFSQTLIDTAMMRNSVTYRVKIT